MRRGEERFVDAEYRCRELFAYSCEAYTAWFSTGGRKSRVAFADKMQQEAFSYPQGQIEEVAARVVEAARAQHGCRIIREATVIQSQSEGCSLIRLAKRPTCFKENNPRQPPYST